MDVATLRSKIGPGYMHPYSRELICRRAQRVNINVIGSHPNPAHLQVVVELFLSAKECQSKIGSD